MKAPARPAACCTLLAVVLVSALAPRSSCAAVAPTTPTFASAWGSPGSAGSLLSAPNGIAADADGNVYVADTGNHRIQKFDGHGHYLMGWGGYGTAPLKFNTPTGVAVSPDGNLHVVDQGNSRIKVFDSSGSFQSQWGSPGTGSGQFSSAVGIAVDAAGNTYVSDGADRIQKFDAGGNFVLQWGSTGSAGGQFNAPAGIAIDARGDVFVADRGNDRIQKFDAGGTYVAQWGSSGSGAGQFDQPARVAVDAVGNVYVTDLGNARIQKFTTEGAAITTWGNLGTFIGQFDQPSGIAVDAAGNVFVTELGNARVQKFSGSGVGPSSEQTPGFAANIGANGSGNGQFNAPNSVATDADGWIYVADSFNYRVQKLSGNGAFSLKFGSPGSSPGQFATLFGIAVDAQGNIYVTSSDNRVEEFSAAGSFLQQWGSAGSAAGQFNVPYGIAVDALGFVYVADTNNHRIQKFTNAGAFALQWGSLGGGTGLFSAPTGIATDAAGNVYVTDHNGLLQKFTSSGTFLTQWAIANSPANSLSNVTVDANGDVYVANGGANSSIQKFRSDGTSISQWGSYGSGSGQFAPATDVAVDPAGNVFVTDYNGNRVVKFTTPPVVLLVSDVGNDQGRQSRLRIKGASVDAPGNGGVTGYAVYRQVEALSPSSSPHFGARDADEDAITPAGTSLAGWDYLGTQPAAGDREYSMVVPTLADANASSAYYTAFMVRALTADPLTHYDSFAEYGYSVDNLAPPAPSPFVASVVASDTHLHWGVSGAADFATFRLYRGGSAGFLPGSGNLVASTPDTNYVETTVPGGYYKLSAVDRNGNESAFALAGPSSVTSVGAGAGAGLAFSLEAVHPNPARGGAIPVSFALTSAEPARLEMIDVAGRLVVRLEVGPLGAGPHEANLSPGRSLAPGLYFVRLRQGAAVRTARFTVVE